MQEHITRQSESQQPQAVTLANPFIIPLHRKKQGHEGKVNYRMKNEE